MEKRQPRWSESAAQKAVVTSGYQSLAQAITFLVGQDELQKGTDQGGERQLRAGVGSDLETFEGHPGRGEIIWIIGDAKNQNQNPSVRGTGRGAMQWLKVGA